MPFDSVPEGAEVRSLPLDEQGSILRDPDRRRSLVAAAYSGTYKEGLITETQRPDDYGELLVVRRADGPNASVAELCGDSDPVDFILQLALDSRSEEHTSELQSLMRISYAVLCLKN